MYISRAARYLGDIKSTTASRQQAAVRKFANWRTSCGDVRQGARGGLLIDCARVAGLSGIDQAQLNALSHAYQTRQHPRWLGRLGDDSTDPNTPVFVVATGPTAGQVITAGNSNVVSTDIAPSPASISPEMNSSLSVPSFVSQLNYTPLPSVSASTLIAAANLPNAPAVVKQAAAQLPASTQAAASVSTMLSKYGIYLGAAFAGVLLISAVGGGSRRR